MDANVVIAGGGLVGASAACALARAGLAVTLIEARTLTPNPSDELDSRVYAISPGSARFLADCGIWQRLPSSRIAPVHAMEIFGDDGLSKLQFSAYEAGVRELACIVEGHVLQRAAEECAVALGDLRWIAGEACTEVDIDADKVQVTTGTGKQLRAQLLLAADGADSPLRQRVGLRAHAESYAQCGVVANFRAQRPHRNVARQWFTGDSVLALLPLPNACVSMVWSVADLRAAQLCDMTQDELVAAVNDASHGEAGEMESVTPARAFSLRKVRVPRSIGKRVALLGDAAHNVHPLAGQGLNLGLGDAAAIARILAARGAQQDCGAWQLLRTYDRARKEDVLAMEFVTDGLQKLFHDSRFAWLRNRGLMLTDRFRAVKGFLIRHALG